MQALPGRTIHANGRAVTARSPEETCLGLTCGGTGGPPTPEPVPSPAWDGPAGRPTTAQRPGLRCAHPRGGCPSADRTGVGWRPPTQGTRALGGTAPADCKPEGPARVQAPPRAEVRPWWLPVRGGSAGTVIAPLLEATRDSQVSASLVLFCCPMCPLEKVPGASRATDVPWLQGLGGTSNGPPHGSGGNWMPGRKQAGPEISVWLCECDPGTRWNRVTQTQVPLGPGTGTR